MYPANFAGVRRRPPAFADARCPRRGRPQTPAQKIVSVCATRFSGGGSCI